MLAGSESDLQRMMDRLNMVSVIYNMKTNTKKTKVLRVSKGSESDNEDSSCRGNYRTSQGILLLSKHEIWGSWIRIKKISISTGKFPKNFNFFRQFYKTISS